MPRNITVTFGDGSSHVYENAPDNVTPDAVQARAEKEFFKTVKGIDGGKSAAPAPKTEEPQGAVDTALGALDKFGKGHQQIVKDTVGGLVRGAGSIGATLLAPIDAGAKALGIENSFIGRSDRREAMDDATRELGANPDSIAYGAGKLGAEIAGTAGVGGVLAKGAAAVPTLAKVPRLVSALGSSGMATGLSPTTLGGKAAELALRTSAGAAVGGASAGLVDPGTAGTGAMVGGAVPGAILAMGKAGTVAADAWRKMMNKGDRAGAEALAEALSVGTRPERDAIIERLRSAEVYVPEASPTVAQALGTPEAGVLNRVVHDSPGGNTLRNKLAQQAEARNAALERVAPTDATGFSQARADMGNAITSRVVPEERRIGQTISGMYENVDPQGIARIKLPVEEIQGAVNKYLGPGSFGNGGAAQQAANTAREISGSTGANTLLNNPGVPTTTWRETQRLRSSIGEAIQAAKEAGKKQEAAALSSQLSSLDETINNIAGSAGRHGEVFTPEMSAAWKDANAAFAEKMQRFHTGPQAQIFKTRNGVPAAEGGQAASIFWGAGPKAAENVKSFRRLVDDNPDMLGRFKSMITTQGAETADASGNLTTKFVKWVNQSLPGLREAFSPEEVGQLQNIAKDLERNAVSMKAGTSLGGSNTYQNASNALNLGLLDSPAITKAANMVPGLRFLAAPAVEGLRGMSRNAKAARLAELLSDSNAAADALETLNHLPRSEANETLKRLVQGGVKAAPVALSQ